MDDRLIYSHKQTQSNAKAPECAEEIFGAIHEFPDHVAKQLMQLRKLIIQTHKKTNNAGDLMEGLRWGQVSYLTKSPITGSTFRLGVGKCGRPALFFHCRTTLVETFRSHYLPVFDFEGNRALILSSSIASTKTELTHCIQQALTYKIRVR